MASTDRMRKILEETLALPEGGPERLQRWLQGLGLPPLTSDEEPYLWLLRGLAKVNDRAQAERTLAAWTADILEQQPDVTPLGRMPDRLLYNLFFFAAGLARPSELWEPLLGVYERRALDGSYLGYAHRRNLVRALSRNQADARLEEVWLSMATGEQVAFLEGSSLEGCWALVLMPDPQEGPGHPALEAIGKALDYQVRELEEATYRRVQLLELCDRIVELYVTHQEKILKWLIQSAHAFAWSPWAISALSDLCHRKRSTSSSEFYLWRPYERILREVGDPFEVREYLCGGEVVLAGLGPSAAEFLQRIFPRLEESRRHSPFQTHEAVEGGVLHALLEIELFLASDPSLYSRVHRARRAFLYHVLAITEGEDTTEKIQKTLSEALSDDKRVEVAEVKQANEAEVERILTEKLVPPDLIVISEVSLSCLDQRVEAWRATSPVLVVAKSKKSEKRISKLHPHVTSTQLSTLGGRAKELLLSPTSAAH